MVNVATFIGIWVIEFVLITILLHAMIFIPPYIFSGFDHAKVFDYLKDVGPLSSKGFMLFLAFGSFAAALSTFRNLKQK